MVLCSQCISHYICVFHSIVLWQNTNHIQFHLIHHHNYERRHTAGKSQCIHDLRTWTDRKNIPLTELHLQHHSYIIPHSVTTDELNWGSAGTKWVQDQHMTTYITYKQQPENRLSNKIIQTSFSWKFEGLLYLGTSLDLSSIIPSKHTIPHIHNS